MEEQTVTRALYYIYFYFVHTVKSTFVYTFAYMYYDRKRER